jgi:hypothetical protein
VNELDVLQGRSFCNDNVALQRKVVKSRINFLSLSEILPMEWYNKIEIIIFYCYCFCSFIWNFLFNFIHFGILLHFKFLTVVEISTSFELWLKLQISDLFRTFNETFSLCNITY